jgi:fructose-bisphosphate aldolase class II/tagatose 1,6-diphosphate aldolase GatY/KbaY
MKLQDKLREARAERRAILATNFYNFETLKGVVAAAERSRQPLVLQLTESSIEYLGLANAIAMARSALASAGVQGWIHLDHGGSLEIVERCLTAGVDSVMFDGSELPMEENIERSRKAARMARAFGACVEAELGYVAKLGQSADRMEHTRPEDAERFVRETGVDALAVAIGTAHGFYKSEPRLDFERLEAIERVAGACLVLHGSSGVPDAQIRRAVSCGIAKINLATEIKSVFMRSLKAQMASSDEIDLRRVFPPATLAVTRLVEAKLAVLAEA